MIRLEVDDKALRVRIKQLGVLKIGDISAYKKSILALVQEEVSSNFESQNSGKWQRLKPATIAQKKKLGFSSDPLVRTGRLKNAVDNLGISEFNLGRSLSIGIKDSKVKRIAEYQQLGTKNIPPRPFLIVRATFSEALTKLIQTEEIKNINLQLSNNI